MLYVFDTSSFDILNYYYPKSFPTFWQNLSNLVDNGNIVSVREVLKELKAAEKKNKIILDWINHNSYQNIFLQPTAEEGRFVSQIFSITHFQNLIGQKQRLKGTPVADPFLIASAKVRNGCVVTKEVLKPNAAKIPNVCEHFNIDYTNVEGFMEREGWRF